MSKHLDAATKSVRLILFLSLVSMVVGYGMRLYLARALSIQEFGLLYAILSFTSIFTIFRDFGFSTTVATFTSRFAARGRHDQVKKTVFSALVIQLGIGAFIAAGIMIFAEPLSASYFNTSSAVFPLRVMMLSFVISVILIIFQSVSQGYEKMAFYGSMETMRIILVFVFSVLLISLGVAGIALSYLLSSIILATAYILILLKAFPFMRARLRTDRAFLKTLLLFSTPIFVGGVGSIFLTYIDTVILTAFRSLEEVGLYNVALPTAQILTIFSSIPAAVLLPRVSTFWAEHKPEKISHGVTILVRFVFLLVLPLATGFIIFSDIIIGTLFGSSYLGATQALRLLEIAVVLSLLYSFAGVILIGIGKPIVQTKIQLFLAVLGISLNILLIPFFGIVGAASTSLIVYGIGFLLMYSALRKHVPFSIDARHTVSVVLINVAIAAFVYGLRLAFGVTSLPGAALAFVCGMIVYGALLALFKMFNKEDERVLTSFGIRLPTVLKRLLFGE